MIFWGVKLDSHKWFRITPFHVALNWTSDSGMADSDWNPAGPTKIKCWMCSGCYTYEQNWHQKWYYYTNPGIQTLSEEIITLRAYLAATYPPNECPSNIKLLRFLAFRHSSKESMNHASVSALPIASLQQNQYILHCFFLYYLISSLQITST